MQNNDIIGRVYDSNNFGKFEVIGKCGYWPENKGPRRKSADDDRYVIRFKDTGCIIVASYGAFRHGRVRDFMKPVVAGVGYVGSDIVISDELIIDFYRPWNDMINRCYNTTDSDYKYYGALGVTVDPRWFNFTLFMFDAMFLPNFEKRMAFPQIYQLDKDYLQFHLPKEKRVYSRDTCIWLSKYDNSIIMNRDKDISSGYFGVYYLYNSWQTIIDGIVYGKFTIPEAAANLFNYIRPKLMHFFNDVMIYNDVPVIPYEELHKYCVGSTTIREIGVDAKWYRSGGVPVGPESKFKALEVANAIAGNDIVSTSR